MSHQRPFSPHLLAGRDLLGYAQTGTGKTAALALPVLQHLAQHTKILKSGEVRTLVLAPTRELALQIKHSFESYGRHLNLRCAAVFGGNGARETTSITL